MPCWAGITRSFGGVDLLFSSGGVQFVFLVHVVHQTIWTSPDGVVIRQRRIITTYRRVLGQRCRPFQVTQDKTRDKTFILQHIICCQQNPELRLYQGFRWSNALQSIHYLHNYTYKITFTENDSGKKIRIHIIIQYIRIYPNQYIPIGMNRQVYINIQCMLQNM